MASFPRGQSNREIETIWRTRLDKAKAAYDLAAAEFRRSAAEYRNREVESVDGNFALRHAVAAENAARREYLRILQVFTDLVVNGSAPPED